MRKVLMATVAVASLLCGGAHAASLQVSASDGFMNVRTGPGTNFALIGTTPNGTVYSWPGAPACGPRQDGIIGADWCKINYNGQVGWVSRSGLLPIAQVETPAPQTPDDGLTCDRPQVLIGQEPSDPNPVTWIEVNYSAPNHAWRIFHHFQNGGVVSRSEQYALVDNTSANKVQWSGSLNRNRSIHMIGEVKPDGYYYEWLYHDEQLEVALKSKCHVNAHQEPLPKPTAEAVPYSPDASKRSDRLVVPAARPPMTIVLPPTVVRPVKDSLPIYPVGEGRGVAIDVLIGGNPIRMLLDTGAMMIQITPDLAAKIVMEKQGSYGRWMNFVMADGRKTKQQVVNIETIKIGSHTLHNVEASVSAGALIMAFPVVNSIAPFKIDTRNQELVFDGTEARG